MVFIYLVQHGIAHPENIDPERHLTEKGKHETEKIAKYLANKGLLSVTKIVHSPKVRAIETAEIFAKFLQPKNGTEEVEGLTPTADPAMWQQKLQDINDNLMIVGHLPHLQKLVALLVAGKDINLIKFRNSAVLCLERTADRTWLLHWYLLPELI